MTAPGPDEEALIRVGMIAQARASGATWAQVARTLGLPNAGAAKAMAKRQARLAQRAAVAQQAQGEAS